MKEEPKWYDNRLMPETELHTHINAIISGTGFVDFVAAIETIMGIAQEDMTVTIRATDPNGITDLLAIPLFEKENGKVKIDPETEQPIKNPLVVPLFCQSEKFAEQREIKIVVNGINYTIDNSDYLKAYSRRNDATTTLVKKLKRYQLRKIKDTFDDQILQKYFEKVIALLFKDPIIKQKYQIIDRLRKDFKHRLVKSFDGQLNIINLLFCDDLGQYLSAYTRAVKETIDLIMRDAISEFPKIKDIERYNQKRNDYNKKKDQIKQRIYLEHLEELLKQLPKIKDIEGYNEKRNDYNKKKDQIKQKTYLKHLKKLLKELPKIKDIEGYNEKRNDYNKKKEQIKQRIYLEHLKELLREMRLYGIKYAEISTTSIDKAPSLQELPAKEKIPIAYYFLYQIRQKDGEKEILEAIDSFINTDERFIGIDIAGAEEIITPKTATMKMRCILGGLIKPGKTQNPRNKFRVLRIHASEFDGMNDNALNYLRGLDKFIESEKAKGIDYMPYLPEIRIGHGIRLPAENQIEYIGLLKKYNITIEINPTSNYLLGNVDKKEDLAETLEFYLTNNIPLVVSTDGNGIYGTTLYEERKVIEKIIKEYISKKVTNEAELGIYDARLKERYDMLREEEKKFISEADFKQQKIAERIEIETAETVQRILDTNNQKIYYVMGKIATETLANLDESLEVNANIMDDIKDEELKKINEKVKKDNENIKEYQTDFSFKPPDRWWEPTKQVDSETDEELEELLGPFEEIIEESAINGARKI